MCLRKMYLFFYPFLSLLLFGCAILPSEAETDVMAAQPGDYREYNSNVVLPGRVVPNDEIQLSFPMAGQIAELYVEEGDSLEAGEIIARLDVSALESELRRAEASLAIAQANLDRILAGAHETQIDEAKTMIGLIKSRELTDSYDLNSQKMDLAAAQANYDYLIALPLPADVSVSRAEVELAKADVEAIKDNLKLAELIAPRNGSVTAVMIHGHEFARAGEPVIQLGDLSNLNVEIEMEDFEVLEIYIGEEAVISFNALPGVTVSGTITKILPNDRGNGRDFIVTVQMDQVPENIRWGLSAEVRIPTK